MFIAGVGTGTWSCYGAYFSELFPTRVRGAAMSILMNVTRGVQFVKGSDFVLEGAESSLRLAYSGVTEQQIDEGITRLAAAYRSL